MRAGDRRCAPRTLAGRYPRKRTVRTGPATRSGGAGAACARRGAFQLGLPPGHARRTSVSRPTTAPNRSTSAAARARSTDDSVTQCPRWRRSPSESTVGTVTAWPARAASVATRARRSSSAAGNRIQSSSGSIEVGAARLCPTSSSRGTPVARTFSRRASSSGQRIRTTSVRDCAFATPRPYGARVSCSLRPSEPAFALLVARGAGEPRLATLAPGGAPAS